MSSRTKQIYKVTIIGSAINIILTLFKFVAGIIGHSSAMIADAVHSLSDLISDAVVMAFVRIADKPEDSDHHYGHGKYETFATLIIGIILGTVGIRLFIGGISEIIYFYNGTTIEAPNKWAIIAAAVSIASKEWLYRYTSKVAKHVTSPVIKANAWHHRSDAYTSIATLTGIAGAMYLGPEWRILDPLAAVIVSIYIVFEALHLCRPALDDLLEKSLPQSDLDKIGQVIMNVEGSASYHHLRTRRIGNRWAISAHVQMDGDMTLSQAHAIATELECQLRKTFGNETYIAIHMEPTHQ